MPKALSMPSLSWYGPSKKSTPTAGGEEPYPLKPELSPSKLSPL